MIVTRERIQSLKLPRFGGRVDCVRHLPFQRPSVWAVGARGNREAISKDLVGGASVCAVHRSGSIHSSAGMQFVIMLPVASRRQRLRAGRD